MCFLGGTLALAAKFGLKRDSFLELGKRLTDTCIEFYTRMPTGLSPEIMHFRSGSVETEMFVKVGVDLRWW